MSIKKPFILGLLLAVIVLFSTSSCKKCSVAETDVNSGLIHPTAIIYPESGGIMSNLGGNYHITAASNYASSFEVSFDGGLTREAIDYSQYNVIGLPMVINCEASFNRSVTVNDNLQTTTYAVTATTCSTCEQAYNVENWVLTEVLPAYTIDYAPTTVTQ
ncbi:MAG: hypothetical protein MK105_06395 [Crocinitomicaceae bacterium]|nr:hypothetical protein [Crocinitomicaceae bacterium]